MDIAVGLGQHIGNTALLGTDGRHNTGFQILTDSHDHAVHIVDPQRPDHRLIRHIGAGRMGHIS